VPVAIALLALGGVAAVVASDLPPRLLMVEDPLVRADAALVMSGDVNYERTKSAAALVRGGFARLLVLTGGVRWLGDSAESLRDEAEKLGVPAARIRYENRSRNTRDSVVDVEPILRDEGVKTVILVTSPFHQRRAYLAARRALPGIRIVNRPIHVEPWPPARWWADGRTRKIVLSEYAKLAYYGVRGWL
jgi:uncharacterized SAM-binding protein YcdF (DUF218 family)